MTDEREPRIVRCTIEMELVEFEHFNVLEDEITDEEAVQFAEASFVDMVLAMDAIDLEDWIQSKIIEERVS